MTALRLENMSHRASTIYESNCFIKKITNQILGTSILQIPTTQNQPLRPLLLLLASTTEFPESLPAPENQILPHHIQNIIIQQPYIQMI